jgi:transcriptional regulator with XRE-family HTH domain
VNEPAHHEGAQLVNELGSFIREQRSSARLSLRRLSELAGISNPYLSQIERGLRRPSAEILQQIAKALRISAETLYVQAGILERPTGDTDLSRHIFNDHHLTEEQRQALLRIYLSFRHENEDQAPSDQASSDRDGVDRVPGSGGIPDHGVDAQVTSPTGPGPTPVVG